MDVVNQEQAKIAEAVRLTQIRLVHAQSWLWKGCLLTSELRAVCPVCQTLQSSRKSRRQSLFQSWPKRASGIS